MRKPRLKQKPSKKLTLLTIPDVSRLLGYSERGFRLLCKRGNGPWVTVISARRFGILERDLEEWLAHRRHVSVPHQRRLDAKKGLEIED